MLRRSEVTARRDNARRADVDRSALQYAMASSLRQLLPEQRLECLELAQVMAASKREDEEHRAGVAVAEARDETQAIVTSNIYQHPLWSKLPDDLIDMVVDFTLRSGFSPSVNPEEDPYSRRAMAVLFLNAMAMWCRVAGRPTCSSLSPETQITRTSSPRCCCLASTRLTGQTSSHAIRDRVPAAQPAPHALAAHWRQQSHAACLAREARAFI